MNRADVEQIMHTCPSLKEKLFARGFLVSDGKIDFDDYPFYGLWQKAEFGAYTVRVSPKQKYTIYEDGEYKLLLIGHAYNPYTMHFEEAEILRELCEDLQKDRESFFEALNELTGIFTLVWLEKNQCYFVGDATCMQTTFYTVCDGNLYIASHTNLLGDLLSLSWDDYIKELTSYRFFKLFGNSLPGDHTQFSQVKRLVPNHYMCFDADKQLSAHRFYAPEKTEKPSAEIEKQVAELLHNNLALIAKKWTKPAISMTGGCDSKTTLACAEGIQNQFKYFSYTSSEAEDVDANAAHHICNALGLEHVIHSIPQEDAAFENIEEVRKLLHWNTGNIRWSNKNDVRKRCFYADTDEFDVEVKSWASEIGRAYYSKRFNGRVNFGAKPTPRVCTTLYKVFLHNRKLVRKTDAVFAEYLEKYFKQAAENPVEWQEQFFWEFRVASWNALVITGEHRYAFDITIPYNNRRILELLLSMPLKDRIEDAAYKHIRDRMNPLIDQTGIAVTNLKHTKRREKLENVYYWLHTHMPF